MGDTSASAKVAPKENDYALGMIGLGRMGANMVRRLMRDSHECVVYDLNPENVNQLVKEGATGAGTLEEFVKHLSKPRAVWVMVPAGTARNIGYMYCGPDRSRAFCQNGPQRY